MRRYNKKLKQKPFQAVLSLAAACVTVAISSPFAVAQSDFTANLIGEAVVLRTLDKVTATTQDFTVPIGDTLDFGSLEIIVKHCEKRPPTAIPETYAFLQITDTRLNGRGEIIDPDVEEEDPERRIFSGWMFASKPAVSALDHRVYDVWVIDCKISESVAKARQSF